MVRVVVIVVKIIIIVVVVEGSSDLKGYFRSKIRLGQVRGSGAIY